MARNEIRARPSRHITIVLCGVAAFYNCSQEHSHRNRLQRADLEALSLGRSLISLQQSTLVLSKQTEEIYACLRLWRAPHSWFNESSSFRDHSRSDGEDVCFVPEKGLSSPPSPLPGADVEVLSLERAAELGAWALCSSCP